MPRYDYICPGCSSKVEVTATYEQFEHIKVWCQRCHQWMTHQLAVVAVIFKGGGFYQTDNREGHKEKSGGEGS